MRYCSKCLTPETRPRVSFTEGVCNACLHEENKRQINWKAKRKELKNLCKKFRKQERWDVLVPCSGGKDGSYVAYKLKHEFGMHPLCFTLMPQIQTEIGRINLENFKAQGFDHILVSPNPKVYAKLAKIGFEEQGQPKMPFINGISTVAIRLSQAFDIPLIMLGEEGEMEYGGSDILKNDNKVSKEYLVSCYFSGVDPVEYAKKIGRSDMRWFMLPKKLRDVYMTHWSKFENWDPEEHARFCSEKTGLQMSVSGQIGTFTNYAQLDDVLQDLHAFMMFVKLGFGRATSDACIEIRKGRMAREDAIIAVRELDGAFPLEYLPKYLDYFQMTEDEFWLVVDKHANLNILDKTDNKARPYVLKEDVRNNIQAEIHSGGEGTDGVAPQV